MDPVDTVLNLARIKMIPSIKVVLPVWRELRGIPMR
jgi:hypothetical protein